MSRETGIEWTDATWNPIRGCSRVSEGCRHCYAETVANRFCGPGSPYEGLVRLGADGKGTGQWNGEIKFVEERLLDPLRWKKPQRIFVNSMSDLFHEGVTDEMLDRIFAVMALCPQHTFQVLTKRALRALEYGSDTETPVRIRRRAAEYFEAAMSSTRGNPRGRRAMRKVVANGTIPTPQVSWPLPNVWLGVSVENQKAADERIPLLLQTPAALRFLSVEPLLGPVTFRWSKWDSWGPSHPHFESAECVDRDGRQQRRIVDEHDGLRMVDWVIVGGESGPGARPMHPDWARSLRDQCNAAGVPFFFKQWGEWRGAERGDPDFLNPHSCGFRPASQVIQWPDHDEPDPLWSVRVGKKTAGHHLDGIEHHEFPAVTR